VREDAAVENAAFTAAARREAAFCIGSGGCTAFSLLTMRPKALQVVDINPAQVYLVQLKRAAIQRLDYRSAVRCIAESASPWYDAVLRPALSDEAAAFWDQRRHLLERGLNQTGLLEQQLRHVMHYFQLFVHGPRTVEAMLQQTDLSAQQDFYRRRWDTWRWRAAFAVGLSRPVLWTIRRIAMGGESPRPISAGFVRGMKRHVDDVLLRFPARENGYLWQWFLGRYPPNCQEALPMYLQEAHFTTVQAGLAESVTTIACAEAADWLERQPPASLDFFALSNTLDVCGPTYASRLWEAVARAARPGAVACLRSFFPADVSRAPSMATGLEHDPDLSERLTRMDRAPVRWFVQVYRAR
jgi:S-adenosylmethionine-diacylglycerol 3-amino-3-carboxypropyl transferase